VGLLPDHPELDRSLLATTPSRAPPSSSPLRVLGACAGCGETPYLKIISQLFGDRLLIANATGCSRSTAATFRPRLAANRQGRGPAWANSLFEDNAEFGLGIRIGLEAQQRAARSLLHGLSAAVGEPLTTPSSAPPRRTSSRSSPSASGRRAQGASRHPEPRGQHPRPAGGSAERARRQSGAQVGLDRRRRRWAYDIGFGGLDHVLASGRDINVLVLDTEVYSNTGGQASKATQRGAVARSRPPERALQEDLGATGRAYGNVYVAQIAIGANDVQTIKALMEAMPGPDRHW